MTGGTKAQRARASRTESLGGAALAGRRSEPDNGVMDRASAVGDLLAPPPARSEVPRDQAAFKQVVRRLIREPFTRGAGRQRRYALFSFLLAIAGFAFVVPVAIGLCLSLSFAGLPVLAAALLGARKFGAVNRRLAGWLLGMRVAPPPAPRREPGPIGWIKASLTDPAGWRACVYLLFKLPVTVLAYSAATAFVLYGIPYLTFPLWWAVIHYFAAHGHVIHFGSWIRWWTDDPLVVAYSVKSFAGSFALIPVGAVVLLGGPWLTRAINAVDASLVSSLLGPPPAQRVRDLEQARARAVDDSAARLRQIERDLHDGAQAQLVAVAMKLGLAREKLSGTTGQPGQPGPPGQSDLERVAELVDAAHRGAKAAIIELRDLARGIHPPALDHGLGTALATLAANSAVPVDLTVDLPERPSPAIETIAYFCAAELLANVAKHSAARRATLAAVHEPGSLRITVSDDGSGGALIGAGGGLAGLCERLRTVDGTIEIASPPGGPTVVTAAMPSHA
ncbi:MAG TPA: sensor domain-containing protein [Streptosporangiaceae bacterium]|nr:sensor domain-containing protein [Streptosporangiaceae bacterium]